MKKFNLQPGHSHKAFIEITPMIDLVFLLVAFFMVSSTLGKVSEVKVDLPEAETSAAGEMSDFIITVDSQNSIYIDGKSVAVDELEKLIDEQYINIKDKKIMISGDKKASYEYIVKVMDILAKRNLNNFILATEKNE